MIVTASQKYIRVSPQKVKFVADAIKKMSLLEMTKHLSYLNQEAARKLGQTLAQALANASHNYGLKPEQLTLESLLILRGPQYKRQRARSRGMGHPILKRTTHIVIKLKSVDQVKEVGVSNDSPVPKEVEASHSPVQKKVIKKAVVKKTKKSEVKE